MLISTNKSINFLKKRITQFGYLDSIEYKTQTADYGLGIKHRLRYKMRTTEYGLGTKHGLRYKMRIEV